MSRPLSALAGALIFLWLWGTARLATAAPPVYDHVVIVIEENHSAENILGSASAPYINNTLVAEGMSFNNFYGITHPSQPNYLQLFSGSNQGLTGNNLPGSLPFTTPNLGAAVIAAGKTFAGYSEDLPSTNITADSAIAGGYRRKHNPWVNWQNDTLPTVTQLPSSTNRDFSAFPLDYNLLPTLSIVVPTQNNDMHDGTIAQGDAWLQTNLDGYYQWAKTHNSLLVVTWDEDNSAAGNNNRIPTIFAGASVVSGTNDSTWTLHNLLRTFEDMYGTTHSGTGANVRAIHGAFVGDAPTAIRSFQQGASGYSGTTDTYIDGTNLGPGQDFRDSAFGAGNSVSVDGATSVGGTNNGGTTQGLLRFDDLFSPGGDAGHVPTGATIISAKLILATTNTTANDVELHRMLVPWNENSTWNSLVGGISANGSDAVAALEFGLLPNVSGSTAIFDVTDSVQLWSSGLADNFGWVLLPTGTDGWDFNSAQAVSSQPLLEITYVVPEPTAWWTMLTGVAVLLGSPWGRRLRNFNWSGIGSKSSAGRY